MPGPSKTRPYTEHGCSISTFQLPRSLKPETTYRARRAHRKSKNGCINCKARKVKCDEGRPHCDRCQAYGSPCAYTPSAPEHPRSAVALARRPTPIHEGASLAWAAVQSDVHAAAWSGLHGSETEQSLERVARVELEVLAHFVRMVSLDEPFYPHVKKVFRDYAIPAALNEPCLLYAILAVGSTHHAQVQLGTPQQSLISAARFRYVAVQLYREKLSRPIHKSDMDVLLSTCLLVGSFSFTLDRNDEDNPSFSWVFNNDPSALSWLSVQGGLWSLIRVVSPWLGDSAWWSAFDASSGYQATEKYYTGRVGLHAGLADLCGIDETTTEETNALYWPLRMLSPLLATSISESRDYVARATNFMGRLLPEYLALLQEREPRALLLLAYWLAVLGPVKEWWIERRARAECRAICMFLERYGDARVVGLLAFPAVMCGYW